MDKNLIPKGQDFTRIVNNFYQKYIGGNYLSSDIENLRIFSDFLHDPANQIQKRYKVALLFICLNSPYWPYVGKAIEGAKKFFLPGHDVDYLLWSDMPEDTNYGATVFPSEPVEWPYPTLMRYHLFLQQEEKLKEYDYIFYCDADMLFVNVVGDEILGNGLTMAQHPMYALNQAFYPPYEPNPDSHAYIKIPGRLHINEKRFEPLYAAGGFQGGVTKDFIEAMKAMKESIDKDLDQNYMARWNDESHWNKYLFSHPPSVVLSPSYIYPDSLIKEYYEKIWGKSYSPKLITLTKPFSVSKEGGAVVSETIQKMQ